jgi:hypothetical protein
MRILRGLVGIVASLSAACGRDQPRPPNTTRELEPVDGHRRVVAFGQIAQPWHVGYFSPATVTLPDVQAGDAIITLGIYWADLPKRGMGGPSDSAGKLVPVIDQSPPIVGYAKPPVFAQIHAELGAAAGRHVITPPKLGGVAGDGTFYVVQVRGISQRVATGQVRATGTAIADVTVSLDSDAAAGDFVIAIGGYDNTEQRPSAEITDAPVGWASLGVQNDASNNVPSAACHRDAEAGRARVTWTWTDPKVNVACAAIAAFR